MALFFILIAAAAAAQQPQAPEDRGGHRFFAHQSGSFMSPMGEPFFALASGEDGLTAWFQQADSNHDGVLTVDEMAADAQRFFQTLDTNHDGEIDPDEITHYERDIAPRVRLGGADDEAAAGRYGLLQVPEPVASADADFNRGVSEDEFHRAAVQRFNLLDVDHSGRLSLAGLKSIREAAASNATRSARAHSVSDVEPDTEISSRRNSRAVGRYRPIQFLAPGGILTVRLFMSLVRMIWHASREQRVA
jgi:Ca2+-binding EF-hand superfamily protein